MEAMSEEQVMGLDAYTAYYGAANRYAGATLKITKTAQADLQLTAAQALAWVTELCKKGALAPAERWRLAGLFVATAEPYWATTRARS